MSQTSFNPKPNPAGGLLSVSEAIQTRRAVKTFDPGHKMTGQETERLLSLAVLAPTGERMVPMRERFETRPAFGAIGPGTSSRALVGGWLRLAEPFVPDAPALAMFCDAWWPAVMQRQVSGDHSVRGVPTIDLLGPISTSWPRYITPIRRLIWAVTAILCEMKR